MKVSMKLSIFVERLTSAFLYFFGGFPAIFRHRVKRLRKKLRKKGVPKDEIDKVIVGYALIDITMHMGSVLSMIFKLDNEKTARVVQKAIDSALNEIGAIVDEEIIKKNIPYYIS